MDGEIGQKVADDVAEKLNVRWLSALYCGARHLDMRDIGREITKPEDLNGVNLRMPNSSAWLFMGKALGLIPHLWLTQKYTRDFRQAPLTDRRILCLPPLHRNGMR